MKKNVLKSVVTMFIICIFTLMGHGNVQAEMYEGFEYRFINDGTEVELVTYLGNETEIVIPETIQGKKVVSLGFNLFNDWYEEITNIVIPSSVTSIDSNALRETQWMKDKRKENPLVIVNNMVIDGQTCTGEVVIPDSVTRIVDYAFNGCVDLESIALPKSMTSIGESAFCGCVNLKSIKLPEGVTSIEYGAFAECESLTEIEIPESVTLVGEFAFYETPWLKNKQEENPLVMINNILVNGEKCEGDVNIPDGVTSIAQGAFLGGSKITNIKIPESVTFIGDSAFEGCSGMTSVNIPNDVTTIEEDTFADCNGLTDVELSDNITLIGNSAFSGCTSLAEIQLPGSVTMICSSAFENSGIRNIELPLKVEFIGEGAFSKCSNLTGIEIPVGVTSIAHDTFKECTSLTSVKLTDSVTSIGVSAFEGCSSLEVLEIPDSVTTIRGRAFLGTQWLENKREENPLVMVNNMLIDGSTCSGEVEIPRGVTIIRSGTFIDSNITSVKIADSVTIIEGDAFFNCQSLTSAEIPDSVTTMGCSPYDSKLTGFEVSMGMVGGLMYRPFNQCTKLSTIYAKEGSCAEEWARNEGYNVLPIPEEGTTDTTEEGTTDTTEERTTEKQEEATEASTAKKTEETTEESITEKQEENTTEINSCRVNICPEIVEMPVMTDGKAFIQWSDCFSYVDKTKEKVLYEVELADNARYEGAKQYSTDGQSLLIDKSEFGEHGGRFYVRIRGVTQSLNETSFYRSDWSMTKEVIFVAIDKTNFPGMYKVMKNGSVKIDIITGEQEKVIYDKNGDGWFDPAELVEVRQIITTDISKKVKGKYKLTKAPSISSFEGVEYFPNLYSIQVMRYSGKKADLSNCSATVVEFRRHTSKKLTVIAPNATRVRVIEPLKDHTQIDLRKCSSAVSIEVNADNSKGTKVLKLPKEKIKLKVLDLCKVQVKSLNLNAYTKLQQLYMYRCDTKNVKVNKCKNLRYIYICQCKKINSLNLKSNKKIRGADFYETPGLTKATVKKSKSGKYTWHKGTWWEKTSAYKKDIGNLY